MVLHQVQVVLLEIQGSLILYRNYLESMVNVFETHQLVYLKNPLMILMMRTMVGLFTFHALPLRQINPVPVTLEEKSLLMEDVKLPSLDVGLL